MKNTEFEIAQDLSQKKDLMNEVEPIFRDYVRLMYDETLTDISQLTQLYIISFILIIPVTTDMKIIKYLAIEYINKDIDFQYYYNQKNKIHTKEYIHQWLNDNWRLY